MGGLVGGITDAVGLTNHKGGKAARKASSEANAFAMQLAKENIAFQKQQYSDWKAIYGSTQENLGKYYKSLTPERLTTLGLQNQQKEYQAAVADISKITAQRGLEGSGLETATLAQARLGNAEARANIRTTAVDAVNQQKAGFLSIGMGTGNAMLSNINNAYNTGVNSRTSMAQAYLGRANTLGTANIDAMGDVIGSAMGWASGGTSRGR